MIPMVQEAERLGYDAVFTAEAWGSDVFTPLAWIGAHTDRIRLGTGIAQMSARAPTATAMAALTLDHLSKGRVEDWGEAVTACVVAELGVAVSDEEVIRRCRERLAAYKVPKRVMFVETLPLTRYGKPDKKALREQITRING